VRSNPTRAVLGGTFKKREREREGERERERKIKK
jgi:hypothetical protein